MRPDFGLIQRQQRTIGAFAGETATWRKYVSASAGTPQYGIGDGETYTETTITGLFRLMQFEEALQEGGQFFMGDVIATLIDCQPQSRDEIRWSGHTYRVESDAIRQSLVNQSAYRVILRRGGATA